MVEGQLETPQRSQRSGIADDMSHTPARLRATGRTILGHVRKLDQLTRTGATRPLQATLGSRDAVHTSSRTTICI